MKKLLYVLLIIFISGCKTVTVDGEAYKVSEATTEIGSIGDASTLLNIKNEFTTHAFAVLENKIRLDIKLMPFNKKMYNLYTSKTTILQLKPKLIYNDSLPVKPEFATISILDIAGYTNEVNAVYNKKISEYLIDTEDSVVITGITVSLENIDLDKIKAADSFYLLNNLDKKYTLGLYKEGKPVGSIDLSSGITLSYMLGKFCWALNDRGQWYVADVVGLKEQCPGNTEKKVKEKKQESLYKM